MSETVATYEIFFRDGGSFFIQDVKSIEIEVDEDRTLKNLNIRGSNIRDHIVYLDIKTISCIVLRDVRTPKTVTELHEEVSSANQGGAEIREEKKKKWWSK